MKNHGGLRSFFTTLLYFIFLSIIYPLQRIYVLNEINQARIVYTHSVIITSYD